MSLAQMTDAEVLAMVEPLMNNCLAGSTERDHAKHVRDFTDRLWAIFTPENLAAQLESGQPTNGYFAERELIGIFRRPGRVGVVWRQFLTKVEGEFVNHAVFVEKDGRVLIDDCLIC
tara:strand:- start:263 stop:613 length:351 start_codon:yes stop_codon:yes gene_type:complete